MFQALDPLGLLFFFSKDSQHRLAWGQVKNAIVAIRVTAATCLRLRVVFSSTNDSN